MKKKLIKNLNKNKKKILYVAGTFLVAATFFLVGYMLGLNQETAEEELLDEIILEQKTELERIKTERGDSDVDVQRQVDDLRSLREEIHKETEEE